MDTFLAFEETDQSKVFANEAFGYWKVTVERPLRLKLDLSGAARSRFRKSCGEVEAPLADAVDALTERVGIGPHLDYNAFIVAVEDSIKLSPKRLKLLQTALAVKDESAAPVIRKLHKAGKVAPDPLHGRFEAAVGGKPCVVEYEPDPELRDTEQIPLLEPGGIEAFFRREVLPHVPDAWIESDATKIGYEISFTRHFYKPQPLRTLEEIRADIEALEKETEGLLDQILVKTGGTAVP